MRFQRRKTNRERVYEALEAGALRTAEELARLTGLRRETVSKQLRALWLAGKARVDHGVCGAGSGMGTCAFVWKRVGGGNGLAGAAETGA